MSVLSATTQKQVEETLVHDGLLTATKLKELKAKAEAQSAPLLSIMTSDGQVSSEVLT